MAGDRHRPARPNPRAVRLLATMLDSARARHDAAQWIAPEDWPDEASRRIAAQLIDGGKLIPADAETDALEVLYWVAIAKAPAEQGAIAAMLAERESVFLIGRELDCLAGRFTSGRVASRRQAVSEVIGALRYCLILDTRALALLEGRAA